MKLKKHVVSLASFVLLNMSLLAFSQNPVYAAKNDNLSPFDVKSVDTNTSGLFDEKIVHNLTYKLGSGGNFGGYTY